MTLRDWCANSGKRLLILAAAPKEAQSIAAVFGVEAPGPWTPTNLNGWLDLVVSGVGKSNAAGATARFLDPERHCGVLNAGIAGVLPHGGIGICEVVVAERSVFADEGVGAPEGFRGMAACGFAPGDPTHGDAVPGDASLIACCGVRRVSAIATVSTCSGTDALAAAVEARTGGAAEAMEGAATGLVAWRLRVPFAEVRSISNTTGDRGSQRWDLSGSLRALGAWAASVAR